jgi:histidine triad (HIT) family protein
MNDAPKDGCVFCDVASGKIDASIVLENELTMAFIDLRQFHPGHILVIPRRHLRDVRDLNHSTGAALMETLSRVARAVGAVFPNEGLSVWHSIGEAAFQEVPHLHVHIHPRFQNDRVLQVYPSAPPTPYKQKRDEYAAALREYLGQSLTPNTPNQAMQRTSVKQETEQAAGSTGERLRDEG